MASKNEMISAVTSIPIRIFSSNKVHIISDRFFQGMPVILWSFIKNKMDNCRHAYRKKEHIRFIGVFGPELWILHVINKVPFHCIYAFTWTIVKYRWLSFSINIYLELLFHLQVAPNIKSHSTQWVILPLSYYFITVRDSVLFPNQCGLSRRPKESILSRRKGRATHLWKEFAFQYMGPVGT